VTASLAERKVTIWKVGSSFSGFLNVGGPPRQGSGSGQPFKSLDFFVADPGEQARWPVWCSRELNEWTGGFRERD
jgi:hypothetical protein